VVTPTIALVAALVRDGGVRACANESGKPADAYLAGAFDFRRVTLRSGEAMTVAVATDPCLARGQSTRIMIFERTDVGYRRVLNDVTLPAFAQVRSDGTVILPTHESMDVMFEATYVWNGTAYVFSPLRSHLYDVGLSERRPYEVQLQFGPGSQSKILAGTVALNFGNDYVFDAKAGQRIAIELLRHTGPPPMIALYFEDEVSSVAELADSSLWQGRALKTGLYRLLISGTGESDETRRDSYALRLSIH
jgi:hypothetical protein